MQDCIISQFGKCNAGTMLSESDVDSSAWAWLQQQGFLKSVADIEKEADSEPAESTEVPAAPKGRASKKNIPATE